MFIISVLSFSAGIYFEAIKNLPIKIIFLLILPSLFIVPFFIDTHRRLCAIMIFLSFFLAGMLRLGFITNTWITEEQNNEFNLFEARVLEANRYIKVLKIIKPEFYKSLQVILKTDKELDAGDIVIFYGELKELSITYKNPYIFSWKWLKHLEGINFELKGHIINTKKGEKIIDRIRRFIKEKIERSEAKHKGIIKALVLGDRVSIDEETKTIFQRTGTSHILAISGLHVGIITGFFFFIIKWILNRKRTLAFSGLDKRYASIITIIFPVLFMILSGASVSTIRATIMVSIFLMAVFFEKQRDIFNTVFMAALFILLVYPHSLFMPSFQLSFLSVIFILLIINRLYQLIWRVTSRIMRWFFISIITTFSATIGTLPVVLYHFYGINFFSVLHNLISIPLICLISLPLILMGVFMPYGEQIISLAGCVIDINIQILKSLDFGYLFPFIRPNHFEALLFYSFVLSVLFMNRKVVIATFYVIVLPVLLVYSIHEVNKRFYNDLCVNFIDVGMGDAILIEAPKGKRILVDGGQKIKESFDVGKNIIAPILLSKKILTMDYVINTHPHGDHLSGLLYIMEYFNVKKFATGGIFIDDPLFLDAIRLCKDKKIGITFLNTGDGIFSYGDFNIKVLNPDKDYHTQNLNNASLVIKIQYHNRSILLTGDIEREIEERMILKGMALKSDVLKVPHHGSKNASSTAFLITVNPKIAVLSAGKGIKGLPSEEALNRYKRLSIPVLSTLENGYISVCTDGKTMSIQYGQK
ncbi:MAG: DNA internalization-related competence protein ComEC/Rec2 [Syntrophorhabdaceae bacterium]|nr:DNA internalization-related competence protein ComEC/Rec2 [Syntrophorhabdaceae bacterium]